ncbi:uncharacterized protein [Antedon mediterranea]|uniref:uncharacterized protein n=1 Tax=Antedon mediterranea TaxID=105859 RepID=UPI003AF9FDD2
MLYGNMRRRMLYLMVLLMAAVEIYSDLNTKTNSTQQALEGANTTLVCTFTPEDGIDITWSIIDESDVPVYNGKLLISRNEVLFKRYDLVDQASLLISNVRQSDAGTYVCSIYSSADKLSYSSPVTLNVLYIPRFSIRKQGNSIRCIPYGNPAIDQVEYYINGTKQPDLEQVTIDERFCNLVTCSAENVAGNGNRTELYCPTVKTAPEKPKDLGNQTLVGVLTSILIFLSLSVVMVIVYLALRPGPDFEQKEGRYDDLFDGPSPVSRI